MPSLLKTIMGSVGKSGFLALRAACARAAASSAHPQTSSVFIAMYHDPACIHLQHLLSKLMMYANLPCTLERYNSERAKHIRLPMMTLTLKSSSSSLAGPLKFIVQLRTKESLSNDDRAFIVNECADIHPQNKSIADQLLSAMSFPVIIDYSNRLLANDDASFDRIMQNYLTCGIQHTRAGPVRPPSTYQRTIEKVSLASFPSNSSLVHPHVAEFADLF